TGWMIDHADVAPAHRPAHAGGHRLGKGLLGREALGQVSRGFDVRMEAAQLEVGQDALGETHAVTRKRCLDARNFHQIHTGTDDHVQLRRCVVLASTMSAFISRTASRMPTYTARLTIE